MYNKKNLFKKINKYKTFFLGLELAEYLINVESEILDPLRSHLRNMRKVLNLKVVEDEKKIIWTNLFFEIYPKIYLFSIKFHSAIFKSFDFFRLIY